MKISVFDFDGTIYDGDSSIDFFLFCLKKNKKILVYIPLIILSVFKYKFYLMTKEQMKENFFSFLKTIDDIDKTIEEFWELHRKKIKPFFQNKKNHKYDIISSASPSFLLEPIADEFEVMDLFATQMCKKSGKIVGKNCYGEEKARLLLNKYPDCEIIEMWSDTLADKPLLELAENAHIVKGHKIFPYQSKKK